MGVLLRDVLKTVCGVNQWSYAVFWKIGCSNSKLLIWEECYFDNLTLPHSSEENHDMRYQESGTFEYSNCSSSSQIGPQAGDRRVHLLINKMMTNNQIYVVGNGLVGRAAFTGNHEWFLAKSYDGGAHPPEVRKEVCQQFSAGMQTVAVIPVSPHGVFQFGSMSTILENIGFVSNVRSLMLQLGSVPGALFSDNHVGKDLVEGFGVPVSLENPASTHLPGMYSLSNSALRIDDHPACSQTGETEIKQLAGDSMSLVDLAKTLVAHEGQYEGKMTPLMRPGDPCIDQLENGFAGAEVILADADLWLKQQPLSSYSRPSVSCHSIGTAFEGFDYKFHFGDVKKGEASTVSKEKIEDLFQEVNNLSTGSEGNTSLGQHISSSGNDYLQCVLGSQSTAPANALFDDTCALPQSGDDLCDIFGVDLKLKLLGQCCNLNMDGLLGKAENMCKDNSSKSMHMKETDVDMYSLAEVISDGSVYPATDNDELLDAVVSKAHSVMKKSSDDNVSCGTSLTNIRSFSIPSRSVSCEQIRMPNLVKQQFSLPKTLEKVGTNPLRSSGIEDNRDYFSRGTSVYSSQLSSLLSQTMKCENSIQTAYSKKNDQTSKPNRKRLKPGENPRPRPKDRQMIQDRLKELREIVPNGAKCSIDALLERTIKHMLFLQNVTKHADKLKHTADSKIIDKEDGLLSKKNFEGGATWAFEVGSQSIVCPIIVEDLNSPRQMLVEMLCEERGFFLEIADLIRGLGLTILKGEMEARDGKIWARFIVEAERDVTRREIFMSLVHLMEQNLKATASGLENKMAVHQSIPQTASVTAGQW